jgi:ABC-type Fe3+/spermidine/putrescine transport system ATPase subunit
MFATTLITLAESALCFSANCYLIMHFLEVRQITKSFGATPVLKNISFGLAAHRTLAVLGRSGCGKTTLLKIIAGLTDIKPDTISSETGIFLGGNNITGLPPQQRGAVYLYQEPLLFPHLTVFENIAFGLRLRKLSDAEIQNRTATMLVDIGMSEHAQKMSTQLSGGQKQRVAFGRALIIQPQLLLLDEPFGALDTETRTQMQQLYKRVATAQHITAVFVTHDLKEALLMGDEWGYMESGNLNIFKNLEAFMADERTGMQQEINFWKKL